MLDAPRDGAVAGGLVVNAYKASVNHAISHNLMPFFPLQSLCVSSGLEPANWRLSLF